MIYTLPFNFQAKLYKMCIDVNDMIWQMTFSHAELQHTKNEAKISNKFFFFIVQKIAEL
jgi:hypothetical protein